jgi:hypothetical protein
MQKLLKNEDEFPAEQIQIAKSKGYAHWEKVVEDSADGSNQKASTASLQMLMRNKYGWDKRDPMAQIDHVEINLNYEKMMNQLDQFQKTSPNFLENLSDQDHIPD